MSTPSTSQSVGLPTAVAAAEADPPSASASASSSTLIPSELTGIKPRIAVCSLTQQTLSRHLSLRCLLRIKLVLSSRPQAAFIAFSHAVIEEFCAILTKSGGIPFNHDLLAVQLQKDKALVLFDIFSKEYPSMFRENMCNEVNRSVFLVSGRPSGYCVLRRSDLDGVVRNELEGIKALVGGKRPYFVDMVKMEGGKDAAEIEKAAELVEVKGAFKFGEAFSDDEVIEEIDDEPMVLEENPKGSSEEIELSAKAEHHVTKN